jgi:hypothetical protein
MRALNLQMNLHPDGLPIATSDTVIVQGPGCGGAMRAPYGKALVTEGVVRLHADWVGSGPDCGSLIVGFVHFAKPVFDMSRTVKLTYVVTVVGRHRQVFHSSLYPAPTLARWVGTGPGWHPPDCRFCPPGRPVRTPST